MEQYQDIYIRGDITEGVRDCAPRYELIRGFLEQYQRPFTVLDLGANLGYFSLRIVEDFPEATVVAVESHYGDWLKEILEANGYPDRLLFLRHHLTHASLRLLGDVAHIDVTLALSVVHHLGCPYPQSLEALRRLGDHAVIELPTETSACGQEIVDGCFVPDDAVMLGNTPSHLGGVRPMFSISQRKVGLGRSYIGSPNESDIAIESDYRQKTIRKGDAPPRDWQRGINLQTFLSFGGEVPTLPRIADLIEQNDTQGHTDLRPWNVVLSGDAAHLIDGDESVPAGLHLGEAALLDHLREGGD